LGRRPTRQELERLPPAVATVWWVGAKGSQLRRSSSSARVSQGRFAGATGSFEQTVAGGVCTVAQDARATNARTNRKRKRGAHFGRPKGEKEKGVDKGGKVVSRREETIIGGERE
jgi:hypothetical protein